MRFIFFQLRYDDIQFKADLNLMRIKYRQTHNSRVKIVR